jgi:hypothetical protein
VKRTAVQALYEIKTLIAPQYRLALPLVRWRSRRGHGEAVTRDTEIVIEGYPRSGSNFAVAAFQLAQHTPVKMAHHTHAPANVIAAVRLGVPTIVLIREPEDSVLSLLIREPSLTLSQALRGYLRFYEPLLPYQDGFVVGPFAEVTTDYGPVIRRVNERFGSAFAEFAHTPQNVEACFWTMEEHYRSLDGSRQFELVIPRPSAERDRIKETLHAAYRSETSARVRARVQSLYSSLTDRSG